MDKVGMSVTLRAAEKSRLNVHAPHAPYHRRTDQCGQNQHSPDVFARLPKQQRLFEGDGKTEQTKIQLRSHDLNQQACKESRQKNQQGGMDEQHEKKIPPACAAHLPYSIFAYARKKRTGQKMEKVQQADKQNQYTRDQRYPCRVCGR